MPTDPAVIDLLSATRRSGFCVVQGYWDRDKCARAVREIERLIRDYPQFIHPAPKADTRIFGANLASPLIAEFASDPVLGEVANAHNRLPTRLGMTLAARLEGDRPNLGSGEGWHRDQFFRSTKAMLYLSDVDDSTGPFQMIEQSYRARDVCADIVKAELSHMQYRIPTEQADKLAGRHGRRLRTFSGAAGTLIVFNASSIHRGKPIARGVRYALTNYYFTQDFTDEQATRQFAPVITSASLPSRTASGMRGAS